MKKFTANFMINDKRLSTFPQRLGIREGHLLSPLLLNILLEFLSTQKARKKIKGI